MTTIERRTITFRHKQLAGLEHPAFEATGAKDGPRLALIGGVHGCEYSSIAAVARFMTTLDTSELSGHITAVPVVNLQSFETRRPFVSPADGKNLNRCFPGDPSGSFTEVLAYALFEELIAPADALVDLHGGDLVEGLEPFAIYTESDVEEEARRLAVAFGLPYVVRESNEPGGLSGMTCSAAGAAGVPAIIAEAGGRGQLEEGAVGMLTDGVGNVLRQLGMLPGGQVPPRPGMRSVGRFTWLRCEQAGWWEALVDAGGEVREGDLLGRIHDLWGDVREEIRAPADGVVLFLTTSPAVGAEGLLLGLGAELVPIG